MSWIDDELAYRETTAEEYRWFDAGWFGGLLIGEIAIWWYYHGSAMDLVVFFATWGVLHYLKLLKRVRSAVDWVEATVKRWAGL